MSVVNKMLRDLEARKADDSSVSADYQPPLKRDHRLWYLLLLCIATGLLVYWFYSSASFPFGNGNQQSAQAIQTRPQTSNAKPMRVAENKLATTTNTKIIEQDVGKNLATTVPQELVIEAAVLLDSVNEKPISVTLPELQETSELPQSVTYPAELSQPASVDTKPGSFEIKDSSQASQTASLKQRLKDALADNNNALSITLLGKLLEQEPDNVEAIKKLAALLFANGNVIKATQFLQFHVQRAPLRGDLRLMLARLYSQQNQPDSALTVLQEIQPAQYMEIDYFAYRANLAQQLADYVSAKQDYTMLTQVDGTNARWWLGLAITEEKLGANKLALDCYFQAQKLAQLEPAVTDFIKQRIKLLAGAQ